MVDTGYKSTKKLQERHNCDRFFQILCRKRLQTHSKIEEKVAKNDGLLKKSLNLPIQ